MACECEKKTFIQKPAFIGKMPEARIIFYPFLSPDPSEEYLNGHNVKVIGGRIAIYALLRQFECSYWPLQHRLSLVQFINGPEQAKILTEAMSHCEKFTDQNEYLVELFARLSNDSWLDIVEHVDPLLRDVLIIRSEARRDGIDPATNFDI